MLFAQLQEPSHNQKEKKQKQKTTTKKNDTNNRALRLASRPLGIYNFTEAYTGHSLSWSIAIFEYLTELLIILEVNRGKAYLQGNSPGLSDGGVGKGRSPGNYISGIWITASKKISCKRL